MTLQELVDRSENLVFLGGAGVSTESGIPDFRSVDGLYGQKFAYPPETMLSRPFFDSHTEEFYTFYREKMLCLSARPNPAHLALARLEQIGKLRAVITQNIDGLHRAAGSKNVLELHGSVFSNRCMACGAQYEVDFIAGSAGVPLCACGGVIKPQVVLYGEGLPKGMLERAARYIADCDCLMVGGTSLNVYPAAGLVEHYRGKRLVLINRSATAYDSRADAIFRQPIGQLLGSLRLGGCR